MVFFPCPARHDRLMEEEGAALKNFLAEKGFRAAVFCLPGVCTGGRSLRRAWSFAAGEYMSAEMGRL